MEPLHVVLSLIGFGILAAVVIGLLFILRALNRGSKDGKSDAGKILNRVEERATSFFETTADETPHKGPTHGELLDEAEAFGAKFVRYGVLTKAEWQPMFSTIATGLTQQEAVAAPAAGVAAV